MPIPDRVKTAAALLLLACLALPFSSCRRRLDADGRDSVFSKKPAVKVVTEHEYVWTGFQAKDPSDWLGLLCFCWPIPILLHRRRGKSPKVKKLLWALEPPLCAGASAYLWFLANFLAVPAVGAYLAELAHLAYGTAWAVEFADALRRREAR